MNSRVFFKKSNRYSAYLGVLIAIVLSAGAVLAQDPTAEGKTAKETAAPTGEAVEKKDAKEAKDAAVEKPATELTEEQREVAEMLAIVEEFKEQNKAYRKEVQQIVERKYDQQRKAVVGSFNRAISDLEKEENDRRTEAIKVFEKFLSKYPDAPEYTPGALWRLAELYYEKSKIEYTEEEDSYDQALAAFNDGASKVEPTPPAPHFERTISLLQRLVQDFPDYKLIDGSYYLMAYCLQEQGEPEEAQASYVTFTRRFPKSKFLPEVWTRLGESYFEDPNKLDQAIDSYKNVLDYPDSRMYDKALYKLAWTYYKVDRFDEAVEKFDHLIAWADEEKDKKDGDVSRSELRKESMQYLAISFAEDEWQGSGVANAAAYFQKLGGRGYDGEFFRKLGEVYYIDAKYDKSIDAYREAIKRYPLDPINPKLMSSIVDSYYRMQQPDKATQAQEELVAAFGPGTRWREANKNETDAILEADKLAENALYTAAVRHHTLAQRFKEQERPEEARQEYAKAAVVYSDYMNRFKDSRDSYKLQYYLAECYYYSLDFEKAAIAYTVVRDSVEGSEFLSDSANAVVLSRLNLTKEAEEAGRLAALTVYTSKDRPKDLELKPRDIPPLRTKLIEACDAFVAKLPKDDSLPSCPKMNKSITWCSDQPGFSMPMIISIRLASASPGWSQIPKTMTWSPVRST
ncbi:MAG: tetratricopeptide repeat protein [Deltaproteobacteria bacterium]|nr:tetratricopeptide repeat protein [Deltaproteobacteria bacterium]